MPSVATIHVISWVTVITVITAALLFYFVATWYDALYTYFSYRVSLTAAATLVGPSAPASAVPGPTSTATPDPPSSNAQPSTVPTTTYSPSPTSTPTTVPITTKTDVNNAVYFSLIWSALVVVIIVVTYIFVREFSLKEKKPPGEPATWGGHIVKPLDTLIRTEDIRPEDISRLPDVLLDLRR